MRIYGADALAGVAGTARFDWAALDAWYEGDEQVFVHPRNPYVRVDALRSDRHVRIELDGVVLAESTSPVLVFETGLPTRYYIDRTDVRLEHLQHTPTETACPYKGLTFDYSDQARSGLEPVISKSSESFQEVKVTKAGCFQDNPRQAPRRLTSPGFTTRAVPRSPPRLGVWQQQTPGMECYPLQVG